MSLVIGATGPLAEAPFADVRRHKFDATQRLLGDSMNITDEQWQAPSLLPGWTRAHVATHLARAAEWLVQAIDAALQGRRLYRPESDSERALDLERGSERSGVELQIDLDTTAGRLTHLIGAVAPGDDEMLVDLRGGVSIPFRLVPLLRLHELVLHHHDLDVGYRIDSVDAEAAYWLLQWVIATIDDRPDYPAIMIHRHGKRVRLGGVGNPVHVEGPDAAIYAWLAGRGYADRVAGAAGVRLPAYG